jgi:hypothetical protein
VDTDSDTTGREIAGVFLILGGLTVVIATLINTLGWLPALLIAFGAGVTFGGYRLATGTESETGGEIEGDPGAGPLYVDPDDPDGLIPRR